MRKPRRIIIISVDTLRADHLGCYGYYRNTSPNIDSLAGECMLFKYAFSTISYTAPSFASLLTSKYPSYHHIEFTNGRYSFPKDIGPMLQQILKDKGLATAAFVSTPVLSAKRTKFNEGFEIYDDEADTKRTEHANEFLFRRGELTTEKALDWLDKNCSRDFLLWIHYMDVHGPYSPPEDYGKLFLDDDYWNPNPVLLEKAIAYNETYRDVVPDDYMPGIPAYQLLKKQIDGQGRLISYEKNVDYYISQYDASIRYVDDQVAAIIARLKEKDIYEDTMLILHSDHGEAFGENGLYLDHGATVSNEQIRVPLIIKLPRGRKGICSYPVSLLDITPSILDFYGLEMNSYDFQGIPIFSERFNDTRIIYSQFLKQLSCVNSGYQILYGKGWFERNMGNIFGDNADKGHKELKAHCRIIRIDSQDDIQKLDPLFSSLREKAEPLMRDFIEKANRREKVVLREQTVSEEEKEAVRKKLAALGYSD